MTRWITAWAARKPAPATAAGQSAGRHARAASARPATRKATPTSWTKCRLKGPVSGTPGTLFHQVELANRSEDVPLEIIVDGHVAGRLESGERLSVSMGSRGALLARIAGTSFFDRYRSTFSA